MDAGSKLGAHNTAQPAISGQHRRSLEQSVDADSLSLLAQYILDAPCLSHMMGTLQRVALETFTMSSLTPPASRDRGSWDSVWLPECFLVLSQPQNGPDTVCMEKEIECECGSWPAQCSGGCHARKEESSQFVSA